MPESARGQLEKLMIQSYTTANYSGSAANTFEVMYNPDEYQQVYDIEYDERQGSGTTGTPMRFKSIKPQQYTIKFTLDGTGVSGVQFDVPSKINDFFTAVGYDGSIHRPRYLKVLWGTLESRCVLLKADITYKLFKPDGTPLRAQVTASFKENVDDRTRVAQANDASPDLTHIRIVNEGDKLPLMTNRIFGDPRRYIDVAKANKMNHFRELKAGSSIKFPPIKKGA
jgi:hypothetical protein